jgi:hypothetical protein
MKIGNLIADLQTLNPDDEIVVAYWTKDIADQYIEESNNLLTTEQWAEIVDEVGSENIEFESIGELIQQLAYEKAEPLDERENE